MPSSPDGASPDVAEPFTDWTGGTVPTRPAPPVRRSAPPIGGGAADSRVRFARAGTRAFPLVTATTGDVVATFAPGSGGRLLALTVAGHDLLWWNPHHLDRTLRPRQDPMSWRVHSGTQADWANIGGSKTWLAPQGTGPGRWDGPPDGVLDSGPWSVDVRGDAISLTSDDDPRSGVRVTRRFVFDCGTEGFSEHITIRNTGAVSRRWSAWEVCQVPTESGLPVLAVGARAADVVNLGVHEGAVTIGDSARGSTVAVDTGVGKAGFRVAVALEHRGASGLGVRLGVAESAAGDVYPDEGCRAEVWVQRPVPSPLPSVGGLHPRDSYAELEVLGPLVSIAPGGSSTCVVRWGVIGRA